MKINNPWILLLAVLIVIVAGFTVIGIRSLAAAEDYAIGSGETAGNGSEHPPNPALTPGIPVMSYPGGDTISRTIPAGQNSTYRTITDMAGRTVTIPKKISLVLCTSPPPTTFVYMLAPEKLGNVESSTTNQSGANLSSVSTNLTTTGKGTTNYEAYIAMHPDLVFISCETGISDPSSADLAQEKLGTIPAVCVDNARNATLYGPTLLFMGDVLGVPDVAAKENEYYQSVLTEVQTKVATIPEEKRVRVYYAEGTNGLSTDAGGSCHSQLIDVCGGINVAGGNSVFSSSSATVTKESILMWKPDAIISGSPEFIAQAYNDSTWQQMPAVQNHRVYLIPTEPYNWFDRPPGVNRIVGIPWTAHILYPDLFPEDWFRAKAKEFYALFYHIELSDVELTTLLSTGGT
ncbi:MAG: ABC transporter substrate-binding protein [Methanoregula sp.]